MYRIAIVDDNDAWCFVVGHVLHQYGYAVSTFNDAESFLREASQFDLALVDFSMPARPFQTVMDGPELICRVKNRLANPPILILISSYFTDDILQQAADLCPEADACLGKNLELTELIDCIERILKKKLSSQSQFQSVESHQS